jgi:photosystem II stability/assembly factor-like uncharacterized protein
MDQKAANTKVNNIEDTASTTQVKTTPQESSTSTPSIEEATNPYFDGVLTRVREAWPLLAIGILLLLYSYRTGFFRTHNDAAVDPPVEAAQVETGSIGGRWSSLQGSPLPDLKALAVSSDGDRAFAATDSGKLIFSGDGGINWMVSTSTPLSQDSPEVINACGYTNDGREFIATGVDESARTSIYEHKGSGEWSLALEGDYGGVAGASSDGMVLVGGGGLIILRQGNEWKVKKIEGAEEKTLYAAARRGSRIVVAGDEGFISLSEDGGSTWSNIQKGKDPFYAAGITEKGIIVGGNKGSLWIEEHDGKVAKVENLDRGITIFAISVEGEVIHAGGETENGAPVMLVSKDGGKKWKLEAVAEEAQSRVVAIRKSSEGWLAATIDGHLLRREYERTQSL